jgi:hypothetical protein
LVYQLFGVLLSIFGLILSFTRVVPRNPAQQTYHEHLKAFDYVAAVAPMIIGWTAAVFLFRLRKLAVQLTAIALGLELAVMTRVALTSNWLEALGKGRAVVVQGVIIDFAILLYAIRLARKGVLI